MKPLTPGRLQVVFWLVSLSVATMLAACGSDSTKPTGTCELSAASVEFGSVVLGDTARAEVTVTNTGEGSLSLKPTIEGAGFLLEIASVPIVVPPGDSTAVSVGYAPGNLGPSSGSLNPGNSGCTLVTLRGEGASPCLVVPSTLDFGRVAVGLSETRAFTVHNRGRETLSGTVSLSCAEFSLVTGGGAFSLTAGESLRVEVELTAASEGAKTCTVELGEAFCGTVGCAGMAGRTWIVRADGTGDAPTIQAAIDGAVNGDEIVVYPGTYFENVVIRGKNVHLQSAEGPEVTIIDGTGKNASVVVISGGSTREMILEGFTITGGTGTVFDSGSVSSGGGVRIRDSSPVVSANIIRDNNVGVTAPIGFGGGLSIVQVDSWPELPSPVIRGNTFDGNSSSTNGGAISMSSSVSTIADNIFVGNEARYDGGAVYVSMFYAGTAHFSGNTFMQNIAGDHGGAIEFGETSPSSPPLEIENCLFLRNEAHGDDLPTDSGTGGALSIRGWPANIINNTFVGNIGTGKAQCTGGSLLITAGERPVIVERNIFAGSDGCAVVCRWPQNAAGAILRDNLFWENVPGDIGNESGCFEGRVLGSVFADPLFCDPTNDDYRLQPGSPALTNSTGVIGAFSNPGCGPISP